MRILPFGNTVVLGEPQLLTVITGKLAMSQMANKKISRSKSSASTRPAYDATRYFHLNDICLWESFLRRDSELRYGEDTKEKCTTQTFRQVAPEVYEVEFEGHDDEWRVLLRALVKLGIRMVRPGENSEVEPIYTLEATFCADYVIVSDPTQEIFDDFVNYNCIHNVWPFWRQHVFDTLKRAELPVPSVPLYAGKSKYRTKQIKLRKPLRTEDVGTQSSE